MTGKHFQIQVNICRIIWFWFQSFEWCFICNYSIWQCFQSYWKNTKAGRLLNPPGRRPVSQVGRRIPNWKKVFHDNALKNRRYSRAIFIQNVRLLLSFKMVLHIYIYIYIYIRCLWDSGVPDSLLAFTPWSNSLLIGIYPADSTRIHVLISTPYKINCDAPVFLLTSLI